MRFLICKEGTVMPRLAREGHAGSWTQALRTSWPQLLHPWPTTNAQGQVPGAGTYHGPQLALGPFHQVRSVLGSRAAEW